MKKFLSWIFSVSVLSSALMLSAFAPKDGRSAEGTERNLKSAISVSPDMTVTNQSDNVRSHLGLNRIRKGASRQVQSSVAGSLINPISPVMKAADNMPDIYCSIIYSASWGEDTPDFGIYKVPTNASEKFEKIISTGDYRANYGGVYHDGVYYINYFYEMMGMYMFNIYGYEVATGNLVYDVNVSSDPTMIAPAGMDVDPITGNIYGIFFDESLYGYELGIIEYTSPSPTKTVVAPLEGRYIAFVIDSKGQFYAIKEAENKNYEGLLCKIDRETGAVTEIGYTGLINFYMTGAVMDRETDRMFWALSPAEGSGFLSEVNLTTGKASVVYRFPDNDEINGLYILGEDYNQSAPGLCQDVVANFQNGSLSGTIDLIAPATAIDGSQLSGDMTIEVLVNGVSAGTANASPNSPVSVDVTVPAVGLYTFTVYASNASGIGKKTSINRFWVGPDTPAATSATLTYANGNMEVSWIPVTSSINGGYLDLSDISYTVKRADGSVAATGLTETSWSESVEYPDELTKFYYTVEVVCGGLVSAPAQTNVVAIGNIVPPYLEDFNNGIDGWTVIDDNKDGNVWTPYGGEVVILPGKAKMDDWLISPAIKLEAGKAYYLTFDAKCNSMDKSEYIEVKMGTAPNSQSMNELILGNVAIIGYSAKQYTQLIVPKATGVYYLGFHGISPGNQTNIYLDNIALSESISSASPAPVTNLKATPAQGGQLSCTISFNASDKTIAGDKLSSLTKIEIITDNTVIKTFNNPTPGEALSFEDVLPEGGEYTYTVVPYNSEGEGQSLDVTAYVGFNLPKAPANVSISATEVAGQVLLTWSPVTEDISGMALSENDVTYVVAHFLANQWVVVSQDLKGTTYTYQAVDPSKQAFVQMAVFAQTSAGTGSGKMSESIPVGNPYNGITESFANATMRYGWAFTPIGTGGDLWILDDTAYADYPSSDGDNGYIAIYGPRHEEGADLISGLVSLDQMSNPALSFYMYNTKVDGLSNINLISVHVKVQGSSIWEEVLTPTPVNKICNGVPGWNRKVVDLSAYTGKVIQFKITCVIQSYLLQLLDNIRVGSTVDYDLAAASIYGPAKVKVGNDFNVEVKVGNVGMKTAESYSVELYCDGTLVDTKSCQALEASQYATVNFKRTMPASALRPVLYYAKVVYDLDANETNNMSSTIFIEPVVPILPAATNLSGYPVANGIQLNWSAPDISGGVPYEITEDFEDAEGFSSKYGDWTFVDLDNEPVGGFQGIDMPGITPGVTHGSFWIWDSEMISAGTGFNSYSGNKYLFALFRNDEGPTDDWAISPELYGGPQTISFYARSQNAGFPEKMEVYYSTKGKDADDFNLINGSFVWEVPAVWTRYTLDLPNGSKYFAIRSYATLGFMFMVDDVTFIPAGVTKDVEIAGYNIYRNGVKINDTPLTSTSFLDTNVEENVSYTYAVTVVYTEDGESGASNEVILNYSGIDNVSDGISVKVRDNRIVVENANGKHITVSSISGAVFYSKEGSDRDIIEVTSGVYVIKVGNIIKKIIVK